MFSQDLVNQLAAELHQSEKSRVQIEHFSKRFPAMTIEDGYAISRAWGVMKIAEGRTIKGHKIGLTSRAMQQASQIDEPDYGTLLDDMFFTPGDIPAARFIAPRGWPPSSVPGASAWTRVKWCWQAHSRGPPWPGRETFLKIGRAHV